MNRMICCLSVLILIFSLTACADKNADRTKQNNTKTVGDILSEAQSGIDDSSEQSTVFTADEDIKNNECDIDLTKMNSTMVYSEVSNMMSNPGDYEGKIVKMNGSFSVYEAQERVYFACIIADATACCSQGIEFLLKNERQYPKEYPALGQEITVIGEFETYFEGNNRYCQLKNALIN